MNIKWDYNGCFRPHDMYGEFKVVGVKRKGVNEHGNELFETCTHDSPEAIGWRVSYDGIVWCPITFDSPEKVKDIVQTMASMFYVGVRYNQHKIKQVLGIE